MNCNRSLQFYENIWLLCEEALKEETGRRVRGHLTLNLAWALNLKLNLLHLLIAACEALCGGESTPTHVSLLPRNVDYTCTHTRHAVVTLMEGDHHQDWNLECWLDKKKEGGKSRPVCASTATSWLLSWSYKTEETVQIRNVKFEAFSQAGVSLLTASKIITGGGRTLGTEMLLYADDILILLYN